MGKYPEVYISIGKLPLKLANIKGSSLMFWPFSIYRLIRPKERCIWAQIRILHETEKALLVDNGMRIWVPKLQIYGIRLRNNIFEIYIKESTIGQDLGFSFRV